jgi:hypothetical protein
VGEELGKIERLEAEYFAGRRKIYVVPLIFSTEEAPPEYREKFSVYWQEVAQHIARLEHGMGKVLHIYHETLIEGGENGLKVMERLSPPSYRITVDRCAAGATLEETEDKDLVEEGMDWERCLYIGFISRKVAGIVSDSFVEISKKRYLHIARRIDETLKADEVGVLFIREGHAVQFPQDIEVFSIVPPALDEIHRWQRDLREHPPANSSEP